ncbi:MAG: DUF3311 domain-containing protein [Pseudonocardia sp.]|jgi:hypothetical protein
MSDHVEPDHVEQTGLRFSPWNLLLLVPFLMLVTPWFNTVEPRLWGMPFFYWAQFAFVPVGVVCVAIVYVTTRTEPSPTATARAGDAPDANDVDDLDEGTANR